MQTRAIQIIADIRTQLRDLERELGLDSGLEHRAAGYAAATQLDRALFIRDWVAATYGITTAQITNHDRHSRFYWPRHIAIYFIKSHFDFSLSQIGELFSRDHSGIKYAVDSVRTRIKLEPDVAAEIQRLQTKLEQTTNAETLKS